MSTLKMMTPGSSSERSYHKHLPQLEQRLFLTDGGLETTLIFHDGIDLPLFAAFPLVETEDGRATLKAYYQRYLDVARREGCGFILESPTWRANSDWGSRLDYGEGQLRRVNQQAAQYHRPQIAAFATAGADMVCAMTLTYPEEAVGIVTAARQLGMPCAISFTTETDARLPDGSDLATAIAAVDATCGGGPDYYMVNCAHPDHFGPALAAGETWVQRIRGVRANASRMSHAELDEATELDAGDPVELGRLYRTLRDRFPWFTVLGGCCGTDHRHVGQVGRACAT